MKGAKIPGEHLDALAHAPQIRTAYPLDGVPTDPDTLAFDYVEPDAGPHDWWCEAREMVVGWMREAYREGQSPLLDALAPIRERATVQQELALLDMERRYIAPRRAAREEQRKRDAERAAVREPAAEILYDVNGGLGGVLERLEELPAEGSFDREAIRKAHQAIAEAGQLVATEERRVFIAEETRRRERRERPAE
ncbi:MAG: hypothetical protein M3P49_01250 [Actinomycetota bacterium]|nr:hypothetical protein [Actinomycetota bacterium]